MSAKFVVMDEQDAEHLFLFLNGKYDLEDKEMEDIILALAQALGKPV